MTSLERHALPIRNWGRTAPINRSKTSAAQIVAPPTTRSESTPAAYAIKQRGLGLVTTMHDTTRNTAVAEIHGPRLYTFKFLVSVSHQSLENFALQISDLTGQYVSGALPAPAPVPPVGSSSKD